MIPWVLLSDKAINVHKSASRFYTGPETIGQEKAPKIGIFACEQSIGKRIRQYRDS